MTIILTWILLHSHLLAVWVEHAYAGSIACNTSIFILTHLMQLFRYNIMLANMAERYCLLLVLRLYRVWSPKEMFNSLIGQVIVLVNRCAWLAAWNWSLLIFNVPAVEIFEWRFREWKIVFWLALWIEKTHIALGTYLSSNILWLLWDFCIWDINSSDISQNLWPRNYLFLRRQRSKVSWTWNVMRWLLLERLRGERLHV
jgi:hypothetical protein